MGVRPEFFGVEGRVTTPASTLQTLLYAHGAGFMIVHRTGDIDQEVLPVFTPTSVRLGCTVASVEALRELLRQWEQRYPNGYARPGQDPQARVK